MLPLMFSFSLSDMLQFINIDTPTHFPKLTFLTEENDNIIIFLAILEVSLINGIFYFIYIFK